MGEKRNCAITKLHWLLSNKLLRIANTVIHMSALNYTHRCPLFSESHWHSLQLIAIDGKFWKSGCSTAPVHDDLLWYICRNFPLCNAFSRVHCIAAAGKCDICVSVSRVLVLLQCNEVWCTGAQWCWNCIVIALIGGFFSTGANAQWLAFINLLRRKFVNLSRPGRLITKENTRFKTLIIF